MSQLALSSPRRYGLRVTVNPVAGFGDSNHKLAHMRPKTIAGAFFVPAMPCHGGCAWETFRSAGCQLARFANLRTAATLTRLATSHGSSTPQVGAQPMKHLHALNPSRLRAAAHRRMALAALHSDSSLATRLSRYNAHMWRVRALETVNVGGVK